MKNLSNAEISKILYEIAFFMDMDNTPFKPRAYEKAAQTIESLDQGVTELYKSGGPEALMQLPTIGEGIAMKIEELIQTGKCKLHKKLRNKIPVDIESLTAVEGLGPKSIKVLYKKLNIKNLKDLEKAAKSGKISSLERFGKKTEENILKRMEFVKTSRGRLTLGTILPMAEFIVERLRKLKDVQRAEIAGSARRWRETVGDIDILVVSNHPEEVSDFFTKMPEVISVYGKGKTKSSVRLRIGCDADLRVVKAESFGSALAYFTGSKDHNIALRRIAISKKLKLNEYGLFKGKKQVAGKTEKEIYKKLSLNYIPPEIRENLGEVETKKLPNLIKYTDLKGDLQVQTNWTDGSNSIEQMTLAAQNSGLEYIAITDHTKGLAMTGGLDEKKILKQIKEIQKLNKKFNNFTILSGSEVNIKKDGSLDIKDSVLKQLDVVGAAVHSNFNLSERDQTKRVLAAMENPNVDILFHPTGRILRRREPIKLNIEKVIDAAKSTKTIIEINSMPDRLDLKDDYIRMAIKKNVKFSINSDAHATIHFSLLKFGIAQARRGWVEKKNVINAWPLKKMLEMLKK